MSFIETDITVIIPMMDELSADAKPLWGSMSAQRMIEHLSDTLRIASGKEQFPLAIPEDKIDRMKSFLESDKPMARNIEVPFAEKDTELRNEEIELAIDEFLLEWIDFENYYIENPGITALHPYYGNLNFDEWLRLHQKHLTHHFEQFDLIK
jgi:hypothetical protein